MKFIPLPDSSLLNSLFNYDKETGVVTARVRRPRVAVGEIIGNLHRGYLRVSIGYQLYQLHRIIWCMVTGNDPGDMEVDHESGVRSDNRWSNLRLASTSGNQQNKSLQKNNTSGTKGVSWDKRYSLWRAAIRVNGKANHLGYFRDKKEAINAVIKARPDLHKEFTNHG